MRESSPLAAAPATERSERVGEEAEFLRLSALSTYAPVLLSARSLTRPPGLSAGENAHGQAATAFASVFMVVHGVVLPADVRQLLRRSGFVP
ncbi:hypothetical protein ACVGAC_005318 [Escherichia coli]